MASMSDQPGSGHSARRLVAILAADVVGYSRLMSLDETATLTNLRTLRRELIDPKIFENRGRIFKTTGDGMLVEFPSAVEAVCCAVDIQKQMGERNADIPARERIEFRVGVNLGDVVVEDGDLHGDGVNVAARLESISEPGGICISGDVFHQISGKVPFTFVGIGEQLLKNIPRPVVVYRLSRSPADGSAVPAPPPLPDKPSIAVLPFQNMSADPEQEYFADGMVEDIITALSHFPALMVIARNSTFTYKGKAVDIKQVGRELGVRYVLEGSVRKAANRIRITGQLIDSSNGAHIWADHFDARLEDIFEVQDEITGTVVGAIAPKVRAAEIERIKRKRPENLDAYDHVLRGLSCSYVRRPEAHQEALKHFYKAIEIDPTYAFAHGCAAVCHVIAQTQGWFEDPVKNAMEGARLARLAAELGSDDPEALRCAGLAIGFLARDMVNGASLIDRSLTMNRNSAHAWYSSGLLRVCMGQPEKALEDITCAVRLSPRDPRVCDFHTCTAYAHFVMGDYSEAVAAANAALTAYPGFPPALRVKAAALAWLNDTEAARAVVEDLATIDPTLTVTSAAQRTPLHPKCLEIFIEGLRKAGMRE
jgi:TolB-like protein/class 3 adenylate cyclase